ncbi:MAG: ABC transporter ATP-binding protein [Anaerolineales bacterium]|nr:ABC transporter ATP-binding protein [Anaerolineales bacterium]
MVETVLQTVGLCKRFGSLEAVKHLDLEVYRGEVFGFLGPNGAGKTTSINMICGLLKPDSGQVFLHGKKMDLHTESRFRIGVCPQDMVLWERLTCLEQLQFVGDMYGLSGKKARQRSECLLEELDLTEKRDKQARTLSGGMQRRLNLALALVHDPDLVVLDEPEAGLDPQSRVKVREYILSLAHQKTILLTTHNMDEADRVVDRLVIMDHGELLEVDTPEALKQRLGPGDVVEIALLGNPARELVHSACERLRQLVAVVDYDETSSLLRLRALHAATHLPAILELLHSSAITIAELNLRANTLEDVFIQLTGRRLRQ